MRIIGFIFLAIVLVTAGVVLTKTGCMDWLFNLFHSIGK